MHVFLLFIFVFDLSIFLLMYLTIGIPHNRVIFEEVVPGITMNTLMGAVFAWTSNLFHKTKEQASNLLRLSRELEKSREELVTHSETLEEM